MMMKLTVSPEIVIKGGAKPGPAGAIFGGIHGNETVGVLAVQELMANLEVARGTVYLAFGNVPAIAVGVRQIGKNLNRCFVPGQTQYAKSRTKSAISISVPREYE